ncbi:DNA methylase [Campylobacter sp. 1569]|uniref:DNA methylase n=1 Tax=Campylobacter sp. 1569 TaxID=2735746 RepID=UPI000B400719|nr:restriction endonuclease subunit S [Campylobacter sp. 1569]
MENNLSQALQEKYPHLEVSVLRLSEVQKDNEKDRIDAEFFSKNFIVAYQKIKNMNYLPLYECLELLTDYHANGNYELLSSNVTLQDTKDYAYMIRTTDLEKMDFENEVKYISKHAYNFLSKTKVFGGEVVINKIGNPGASYFIPFLNKPISLGMNLFLLRTNDKLNSAFLYIFLNTNLGKIIIERKVNGAVPQTIDKEAIKSLPIPILPIEFQLEIEKMVKDSHKALEESKELYKKAEETLYLELGLDPKNPLQSLLDSKIDHSTKSLNISIRTLKKSFLKTGRLDSEYYQKKYEINEKIIMNKKYTILDNLVSITKSIEPGSNLYKNKGIPFIRVANLTQYGLSEGDVFLDEKDFFSQYLQILYPKKDTILFSKDGSVGIAYCVKEDKEVVTSSAILHLNIKDKENILPEYLTLFLNSIFAKLQAQRDCGGSIISHWRIEDIKKILVAILDIKTQEKIAKYIQESFNLRKKSKQLLDNAKIKVEEQIQGKT